MSPEESLKKPKDYWFARFCKSKFTIQSHFWAGCLVLTVYTIPGEVTDHAMRGVYPAASNWYQTGFTWNFLWSHEASECFNPDVSTHGNYMTWSYMVNCDSFHATPLCTLWPRAWESAHGIWTCWLDTVGKCRRKWVRPQPVVQQIYTPDASKNNFLAILLVSASRTNARATTHWTDSWLQTQACDEIVSISPAKQTPAALCDAACSGAIPMWRPSASWDGAGVCLILRIIYIWYILYVTYLIIQLYHILIY